MNRFVTTCLQTCNNLCVFTCVEEVRLLRVYALGTYFRTFFRALVTHVTRCNFSCNLQCNSTLERCQLVKSVKNFRYVEKTSAECNGRLVFGNFTSLKSRIALQVARKIAPCNMVFTRDQTMTIDQTRKLRTDWQKTFLFVLSASSPGANKKIHIRVTI